MLIEKHTQKGEKGYFSTPGKNYCGVELGGWVCTRRKGHKGLHAAHRLDGIQVATWSDEERNIETPKRKTPTCIADDPDFTSVDISHGEPLWITGNPAISSASEPAIVSVTTPTRTELQVEILQLRAKLHRIRDWLKHMANSPGGIVAEIDELLKQEGR